MKADWLRTNLKWISIIFVLVLIILAGSVWMLLSPPGKVWIKVESFEPRDEVPLVTKFTIEFSQDLAHEDEVGVILDSVPVRFSPPIDGKFQWIAQHILQFVPNAKLLPSTRYTAEILPKICEGRGYLLKGKRTFKFYTPKFRVKNVNLSLKLERPKAEFAKIMGTIEFNYPVDPSELADKLNLSYRDGRRLNFQFITQRPSDTIQLESEKVENTDKAHRVQLTIDDQLRPLQGTEGLTEDYVKNFDLKVGGDLKVEGIFPERLATVGCLKVRFSSPVDAELAKAYISVEPSTEYQVIPNMHYIELRGNFLPKSVYSVSIKEGLTGVDGSVLKRSFSSKVVMLDIEPTIRFVGDGIFLSRRGKLNLGLSTINIRKLRLEIRKIYANNLVHLIHSGVLDPYPWYDVEAFGKVIHTQELTLPQKTNEEIITPINMGAYISKEAGVFDVLATSLDEEWRSSHKLVMITDLGLTVKVANNHFLVWVNSLSSLKPIDGAEVTLISRNNQVMKKGITDRDGVTRLEVPNVTMENFVPFIITASKDNDLSFVELDRSQISTTDFDVNGRPYLQHGYDAYVYGDRDIYRPGENVKLVVIVRGPKASVPPPFPIKLQILGPDNRIFNEFKKLTNDKCSCEFSFDVPTYAMTGFYTAKVIIGKDEEIGRGGFSVEEFLPDRIKVSIKSDADSYYAGQNVKVDVSAISLFGPPASGRRLDLQMQLEAVDFSPQQWKSFTFSNHHTRSFDSITNDFGSSNLDENGKFSTIISLPSNITPPSSIKGTIAVTVHEFAGRTVTGYRTIGVHPYRRYVGLRQVKEGYVEVNKPAQFEFIVLDKDGQPIPDVQCDVFCYRITWQTILKKTDDRLNYVSEKHESLESSFSLRSKATPTSFQFAPEQYGEYRIEIRDQIPNGHSASVMFYASGWGFAPWAMERPERLEIDLDKKVYNPGERAKVQIRSPFSGKLLLTIEGDKIYHVQSEYMKENTATINIKISEEYIPNVYVSASVIRSTLSLEQNAPVRAYGVAPVMVDSSKNRIDIDLDVPSEMRPNRPLTVSYTIKGKKRDGYITVAAVDEGICQLTGFQTPDPFNHFFGKKRLEVTTHDVYSAILPEVEQAETPSSVAGGEPGEIRRRVAPMSVARVKPVALWSGMIKIGKDGRGKVTFDIPQFNGSIRIMAVCHSDSEFGSKQKNVIVREPIVLTSTIPRFIASGDRFQVPVSVFNGTDGAGTFTVSMNVEGPVQNIGAKAINVRLEPKEEKLVTFSLKADRNIGKAVFKLTATGQGESASEVTEVPVRSPFPPLTLAGSGTVKPGKVERFRLPGNWEPNSAEFKVIVSSFPVIQFAGSLQYLLQYPYGCAEQVTSRVFPLLYFDDIAKVVEPDLFGSQSPSYFINEGINKLISMQMPSGEFAFWPSMFGNRWVSIYVSHFMVEARRNGFDIPDRVYNNMIRALQNISKEPARDRWQLETKVYACYVLALSGQPDKGTMLFLKNSELDRMPDYSQYQLAGAFALSGDLNTARSLLPSTISIKESKRETGGNLNSSIRAQAIMLDILAEIDPDHPSVPKLIRNLTESASKDRWSTTQENAFALLALGKVMRRQPPGKFTGALTINGKEFGKFDSSKDYSFSGKDWGNKEVSIEIQGTGTCYYYWSAFGIPTELKLDQFDNELIVRRRYLNNKGNAINYSELRQGDLIVAEVSAKALTEDLNNVVIVDLLPTGIEIENPRLGSRAGIPWIKDSDHKPDYMDIRDDRMIIFTSVPRQKEVKIYYALRVVNVGEFILPPVSAEAMYDPAKASLSGGGTVRVLP